MSSVPGTSIRLRCHHTGECEILRSGSNSGTTEVRESFLSIRFSLDLGSIFVSKVAKNDSGDDATYSVDVNESSRGHVWLLEEASTYVVFGNPRALRNRSSSDFVSEVLQEGHQTREGAEEADAVEPDNPPCRPKQTCNITPVASENDTTPYPGWDGVPRDPFLISAFDATMSVSKSCELGKIQLADFKFQRVLELPPSYNGNIIFELPPVSVNEASKRNGFRAKMDRRNDCYLWTKLITIDVGHGRKKMFEVSQMSCVGSIKCSNLACCYKSQHGSSNVTDWPTGVHRDQKYTPVHVGTHCHPPRSAAPLHLVDLVEATIKDEFAKSPRSSPSILRKKATGSVLEKLSSATLTLNMTEE
ncbi:hypothetical protein R1sor_004052 [Riccia sorocarpa]|uniref:Uncharacterized protein n=1 Tax=Riccia sorocarpa TaxID=122646 RepID=A0ABD3H6X6_9MARC